MRLPSLLLVLGASTCCALGAISCSGTQSAASATPGEDASTNDPGNGGRDGGGSNPTDDGGTTTPDLPWEPPNETGNVAFPYKAYRCGYSIRQVSPSKPAAVFHTTTLGTSPEPRNIHLTFAGDPSREIVIQWSTDAATTATEVRFGSKPDALDKVARGYSFTYGVAGRRQHEVHLCGLQPGQTYYYDVGTATARSKAYSFVTAPSDASDIDVLVVGDTRSNPSVLTDIWAKAKSEAAQVMVLSGDAVDEGNKQNEWDDLFEAAPELWATIPGIWAHGNHEGMSELYFAQFALPDHGETDGIEEWFATTYGPMKVVVVNDTPKSGTNAIAKQATFLESTLGATDRARTPFVIGLHHKPMYTTSLNHGSNTETRNAWGTVYAKHHLDVDIAGHVHSYESTKAVKAGTTEVVTDQTGTRFFNFGGGGAPLYNFLFNQDWIQKRESTHGYAIMTITRTKLDWVAHRADGSVIETISISK